MKVTEIEVHPITLEYVDWIAYQLNHFYGPITRTVYVVHTDNGLVGLGGEWEHGGTGGDRRVYRHQSLRLGGG